MVAIIKKYSTFIKYIFSAGTSFVLDLVLFTIFTSLLKGWMGDYAIFLGTVFARILSSFYNYLMNRNAVFSSSHKGMDRTTFIKYYLLVVVQMLVSSSLVFVGYKIFTISETIIKVPVDVFLFMVNYFIQKKWIFTQEKRNL